MRRKRGSGGVDGKSLKDFEENLAGNLYKVWNRLSSGSYFPPPVLEVEIPKEGGVRRLGIPTIGDRVAQTVIKRCIEGRLEAVFHAQSYGYRPSRSAHDALDRVNENCRHYGWVLDVDIAQFFDKIDHELLMRAVERHVEEKWIKMYIRRWLTMPIKKKTGKIEEKEGKGTPQGGVISPLLANLFLHYGMDKWLGKRHGAVEYVRYADDIIIHCTSKEEAKEVLRTVRERLEACKLSLNEKKTRIVQCHRVGKREQGIVSKFDFLGYSFQPRSYQRKGKGELSIGFMGSISKKSEKRLLASVKREGIFRRTAISLQEIAKVLNPKIRGWLNYYGKWQRHTLGRVMYRVNKYLAKWLKKRYKRLKGRIKKAYKMLQRISRETPRLFYHWEVGLQVL